MIIHILFDPFINYGFMRRAIVACCSLSMSVTPIGIFLILRRMSLMGDALSHAILPGVAIGYFFFNMSFIMMSIGGFMSGLIVAFFSDWVTEKTSLYKDAIYSGLYLGFLSFGVVLIATQGSDIDLFSLLFGSILLINMYTLKCVGIISTITVFSIAFLYRALVIETFDSDFLKENNIKYPRLISIFFSLILVLNLIASLQVTGTLMAVGLMMLPGLSARCWVRSLINMLLLSLCIAWFCSWIGLLIAFYISLPAGPVIVLCASIVFLISILFGSNEGVFLFMRCNK